MYCAICGIKLEHEIERKPIVCDICKKTLPSLKSYTRLYCRDCGVKLTNSNTRKHANGKFLYRCRKCESLKVREGQKKIDAERGMNRHKFMKIKAVTYKGGKCAICGLEDTCLAVYDFHHLDPTNKTTGETVVSSTTWEKLRVELDKCIMVCANCHRRIHNG